MVREDLFSHGKTRAPKEQHWGTPFREGGRKVTPEGLFRKGGGQVIREGPRKRRMSSSLVEERNDPWRRTC